MMPVLPEYTAEPWILGEHSRVPNYPIATAGKVTSYNISTFFV
jgi:hypothetical protein